MLYKVYTKLYKGVNTPGKHIICPLNDKIFTNINRYDKKSKFSFMSFGRSRLKHSQTGVAPPPIVASFSGSVTRLSQSVIS